MPRLLYPAAAAAVAIAAAAVGTELAPYRIENGAIAQSLTGAPGDPARGRLVAANTAEGNCIICHVIPIAEVPAGAFGDLGPPLAGVGARLSEGELRLRVVDSKAINPETIMPAYHRVDGLQRVAEPFGGQPILTAAQVEDVVAFLATLTAPGPAAPADDPAGDGLGDRRSGYTFLTPETRALQDDAFANPGLFWVDQGAALWESQGCVGCHGAAETAMHGVAARHPAFDEATGTVINLEQRINQCRTERQGDEPFAYESPELLALTAFVAIQSRGLPVEVAVDGPAATSFARGEEIFQTRVGQLDLACSQCHDDNVGRHLRAEAISQGQINGFPVYRLLWQTLGSSHRMFAWCNEAVRAEPYALGGQDYVDLELYVRWRGRGLAVEAPAVRR